MANKVNWAAATVLSALFISVAGCEAVSYIEEGKTERTCLDNAQEGQTARYKTNITETESICIIEPR